MVSSAWTLEDALLNKLKLTEVHIKGTQNNNNLEKVQRQKDDSLPTLEAMLIEFYHNKDFGLFKLRCTLSNQAIICQNNFPSFLHLTEVIKTSSLDLRIFAYFSAKVYLRKSFVEKIPYQETKPASVERKNQVETNFLQRNIKQSQ